ncbi:sulfite exporter TauE/SafE family protein [Halalkalibacter kiskunsagensis]|uniref:Probable membrane transporter protein n=1 Tax=Halalkalibacter kiskunsagensis TaxID=1548599 RepID=A0ABV6KH60_9BACI
MMDLTIIIVGLLIMFLSAVVQGTTGFGFALTSMPLLTILLSMHTVVPIMVVFGLCSNILILIKVWSHVKFKKTWLFIASSVIGVPLGTYILLIIDQNTLKIITGFLIVLFALALWRGYSLKIKNEKLALIPVGFSSGLLNGSISLSGPPVVLFLTNQGENKTAFRANLTSFSLILNIITIATFFVGGLINKEVMTYVFWFFPALFVGTFLGIKIASKVEQALFRKITLGLIIISGVSAVFTSL